MFWQRLRSLFRRRRLETDLAEELAFHEALKRQELINIGMTPEDATLASRRALGSVALAHDRVRDVRQWRWLSDLGQDIRLAMRRLFVDKRFTAAVVGILALGIGAITTVFTMVDALVLQPVPFDHPDELVALAVKDASGRELLPSYPDFQDWRAESHAFAGLFGEIGTAMNLVNEPAPPERAPGSYISTSAFRILGRTPVLGRDFTDDDERPGAAPVAILSYGIWQSRFAGRPDIVGLQVRVNDVPATIVGVMPPGFAFPIASDIWQPLTLFTGIERATRVGQPRLATPTVFGRLLPDVTPAQARAELATIAARIARDFPSTNSGVTPVLKPIREALPLAGLSRLAWLLSAAVGFLLLIVCANVANLLLARSIRRTREVAIRTSLGATRWRIIRQHLVESSALAAVGGACGLILAFYGVAMVSTAFADPVSQAQPYWLNLSIDRYVLLFVAFSCAVTPLLFGLLPAVFISRTRNSVGMKDGGHGAIGSVRARRWTSVLMVVEFTLTLVLLVGAGLMLRSIAAIARAGLVVDTSHVLTMRLAVANQKYPGPAERRLFFEQLGSRLSSLPDVLSATVASDVPLMAWSVEPLSIRQLEIDGRSNDASTTTPMVQRVYVGEHYFETLGVRPFRGRGFEAHDGLRGQEGAIVNERFAAMFFRDEDIIGRRIRLTSANSTAAAPWLTIVGVTPTVPQQAAASTPAPVVYVPVRAEPVPHRFASIIVRTRPDAAVLPSIRSAVQAIDPDLPVYFVISLDGLLGISRMWHGFIGELLGIFAAIALVLASAGLYAVTSYGVAERAREIGIRMALGALPRQITWFFARGLIVQLMVGLAAGLGGALAVGRVLESVLVGTGSRDPLTLIGTAALLVSVSIAACVIPARRAARLDPMATVRMD